MGLDVKGRILAVCGLGIILSSASWITNAASAQTVIVDSSPSDIKNTFSPVRSLGASMTLNWPAMPARLTSRPQRS